MNFLSDWIEGIAIAVIIVSIFEMVLPNGNTKKYIKVILGIYVIFSIISPFVNSKELYSLDISDMIETYTSDIETSSSAKNTEGNLEEIYIDTFEKEITNTIEKKGYNVKNCLVEAVFDTESEDFGITKITITLDSKNSNYKSKDNKKENEISNIENVDKVEVNISQGQDISDKSITNEDIKEVKKYLSEYYELDKRIINIQ